MFLQVPRNSSPCWVSPLTARLPSTKCQSPSTTVSVGTLLSSGAVSLPQPVQQHIDFFFLCLSLQSLTQKILTPASSLCTTATVWIMWQMTWQVGTQEVSNCMCLSWIISFGAEGCCLNSADLILMITTTTTQRPAAITHQEWLLYLHELSLRWLHPASQSGMEPPLKGLAGFDWQKASLSCLEYKLQHRRDNQKCMIQHLGHFFSPEIIHRRWTRVSLQPLQWAQEEWKARTNIFIQLLNRLQNTDGQTLHLKPSFTPLISQNLTFQDASECLDSVTG